MQPVFGHLHNSIARKYSSLCRRSGQSGTSASFPQCIKSPGLFSPQAVEESDYDTIPSNINQEMPCICIKDWEKADCHRIEGIELSSSVSELKERAAEKANLPAFEQNLIYGGLLLKDDSTLDSYGLKDGSTVHMIKRPIELEPIEQDQDVVDAEDVIPILEAAIKNPSYRSTVEKILNNPDTLEQLTVTTPGLSKDPVAMTLLQDPGFLQQLLETADVDKIVKEHPSLVQAASYIAAALTKEVASQGGRHSRTSRETDSDEEDMPDLPLGIMAQAELLAANEERIQASQTTRQRDRGTTSRPLPVRAGPSTGAGPSTSAGSPSQPISREMFRQAMASAMGATSTTPTSSQMQSQLQQLRDMGFTNDATSLEALIASNGDIQAAVELIYNGGLWS